VFAQKVQQTHALMAAPDPDWKAIDSALLEMEKARVEYNRCRDMVAQQLLSEQRPALRATGNSSDTSADRVRAIAELRWELAGRPDGTAEENWYRAEEILRQATAA